ncbi:hypothetical protein QTP88_011354 [Uroleucon formosanum]
MTDDSATERSALKQVWPSSRLLLCIFHVLQKEWGWLHEIKNIVLYATDEDNFYEAVNSIQNLNDEFPTFDKQFENYLKRKNEWVLMYRRDILTRGNNTNNYAEILALVEFICNVWEDYLILRILDHAHNRRDNFQRNYSKLFDTCYSVPSTNNVNSVYTIDIQICVCDCYVGYIGAFCKHQAFLHKYLNVSCPSKEWFMDLKEKENTKLQEIEVSCSNASPPRLNLNEEENEQIQPSESVNSEILRDEVNEKLDKEFLRVQQFLNDVPLDIRQKLENKMTVIKNAQQLTELMVNCSRGLSIVTKRKGQIKVQPNSISRRRQGVTRGSRRIPSERPPTSVNKNSYKKKPQHWQKY